MQYDIFNGDADGICSLHQLRLTQPSPEAQLITGVKRDIKLLARLGNITDCVITVFDISLDHNREDVKRLSKSNIISYFDHHFAGDIPHSANLTTHIDPSPQLCTALIVNNYLQHKHVLWGICGAFGDNLHDSAHKLASEHNVNEMDMKRLKEVGELFNYNGYGSDISDLHIHPQEIYKAIIPYENPLDFHSSSPLVPILKDGFIEDLELASSQINLTPNKKNRVYHFPQTSWARRMTGTFSNLKAREKQEAAHVIIVENNDSTLQISVRAPLVDRKNADTLCRQFPTGGGRAAAAGINSLPKEMLDEFLAEFHRIYT